MELLSTHEGTGNISVFLKGMMVTWMRISKSKWRKTE